MKNSKTKRLTYIAVCTACIAVSAFIRIPLYPLSFTLQVLAVSMTGFLLGSKDGAVCVLLYVLMGLCGLPIFTQGGGIGYILQPSFGYLLGFVPFVMLCGIAKTKPYQLGLHLLYGGLAWVIFYTVALSYLLALFVYILHINLSAATIFTSYFLIFLPTDWLSIGIAAVLAKRLRPLLR